MSKENFLRLLLGAAISMAGCAPVSASFSVSPEAGFDALDDYRGKPESRGHQCLRSCKWSALQAGIRTTAAFTSLAHSARHFSAVRYRGVRLSGSVRDRRTAALQLAPVFILMLNRTCRSAPEPANRVSRDTRDVERSGACLPHRPGPATFCARPPDRAPAVP